MVLILQLLMSLHRRSRERYSAGDYYNQDSKNGGYHDSGSRSRKVRDERDRDYRR